MASQNGLPMAESAAEEVVTQDSGAVSAGDAAAAEVPAAAAVTADSADVTDAGAASPDGEPTLLSSEQPSRSINTQTERPAAEPHDAEDSPAADGGQIFPVRRAISDWAILDRSPSTAHIRSERIRRTAQLFEDLALAQEEREAAMRGRRGGRRSAAGLGTPVVLPPEREVRLVPLPAPPPEQTRRVDAILALGSGGGPETDSDAEGDVEDEEQLWEKIRTKIAARRNKFRRLESGEDESSRPAAAKQSTNRLSADRTSWLTSGRQAAAPSKQQVAAPAEQKKAAPAQQQAQQTARPARVLTAQHTPTQNGHSTETTRSSSGKYIEQSTEQEVLRSLGSAVLAKQKLAAKEKARNQLINDKSEAERRLKKAGNQRVDAQSRLQKTKGKLTRDSAFERKGLEHLITRLDGTIREETRKIDKLAGQIADADAGIEELRRRAAA